MNRIELLASLAQGCNCLADIGCDHGFISITALSKYKVEKAYACDVASLPLESAKNNIRKHGYEDKILPILSFGFEKVPSDFDCAILAGMGGILICDIIRKDIEKLRNKRLVLQANKNGFEVREFMQKHGFQLIEEYALLDAKRYYEIFVYKTGEDNYSNFELKYGPFLLKDRPTLFVEHYQKKLLRHVSNLSQAKTEKSKMVIEEEIDELKKVLRCKE